MKMINLGGLYYTDFEKIIAILPFKARMAKNKVKKARAADTLIDCTGNRSTLSVLLMKDGIVLLTPISPKTLVKRVNEDASLVEE